ncbi:MAG: glycine--tRNA ligase subunit beta, partial [Candidatus Omnitrophota bacterium]
VHLPKTMRWDLRWAGGADFCFSRPVRSFLCFYGAQTLKNVKIAGIGVGTSTRLLIKARHEQVSVRTITAYFDLLKKKGLILDPVERKNRIRTALEAAAKAAGVRLVADPMLLSEITYLTEMPQVISAVFDNAFLDLPAEVLTVSMARKQRIFGSVDAKEKLANRFFGVLDRRVTAVEQKLICDNFGSILKAKLQDSLFFFREDSKMPLEQKARALDGLIFIKNAGSMFQKSCRLVELSGLLSKSLGMSEESSARLSEAARLCKADLLTQMVGEFPELQGVMGHYYAKAQGLPQEVAMAIGQQYLPRTADDRLPDTQIAAALSLIDKVDLITTCFCLGLEPSSSADPYALRRSASAIAKITFEHHLDYSLDALLERCRVLVVADLKNPPKKADPKADVAAFIADRAKAVLAERGYAADLIEAVFAGGFDRLDLCASKLASLQPLTKAESFVKTCKVIERITNILKATREILPEEPDVALFQEQLERDLFQKFNESNEAIIKSKEANDVKTATDLYAAAFFDILGEFFTKVFINAEDSGIRRNRLALLKRIRGLYVDGMADLSFIKIKND